MHKLRSADRERIHVYVEKAGFTPGFTTMEVERNTDGKLLDERTALYFTRGPPR